jgi:hypothetical protein
LLRVRDYREGVAARSSRRVPVLCLITALAVAGCSKASHDKSGESTPSLPSSSAPASSSATPTPTPIATVPASLGGRCSDLLPVIKIDGALGKTVVGKSTDVLGIAEPNIGRLTYLNCRYGLSAAVKGKPTPVPQVEIGISLYKSVAQAAQRVQGTVEDYRSHGSTQQAAAAGTYPGTVLIGFGAPTIVVAAGPRTVAVTVLASLIAGTPTTSLVALAKAALDATAQYVGAPGASTSPSSSDGAGSSSVSDSPSASTTS